MRRNDREITAVSDIERVIDECLICRMALSDGAAPYVVPLCFGYRGGTLYFHSVREGKKIEVLRKNNRVCIEFDAGCEIVPAAMPCKWTMKYTSVIAYGRAEIIDEREPKAEALNVIMQRYSGATHEFPDDTLQRLVAIKVPIESMSGKAAG